MIFFQRSKEIEIMPLHFLKSYCLFIFFVESMKEVNTFNKTFLFWLKHQKHKDFILKRMKMEIFA